LERCVYSLGILVIVFGFAATLSRGAIVAAVVTGPVALVIVKSHRRLIAGILVVLTAVGTTWLRFSPAIWGRLAASDRGDGRYDLWRVAWRIVTDHPFTGVGTNNFLAVEGDYLWHVGPVPGAVLILTRPHEVHNVYLQLFAEDGIVGLALFIAFAACCLRAGVAAARRLAALGDEGGSVIAYAISLSACSLLVGAFFLSSAVDQRLWILLALGPAAGQISVKATNRPSSNGREE